MYSGFIWLLGICLLSVNLILNTITEIKISERLNKVEKSIDNHQKILERLEKLEIMGAYNIIEKD